MKQRKYNKLVNVHEPSILMFMNHRNLHAHNVANKVVLWFSRHNIDVVVMLRNHHGQLLLYEKHNYAPKDSIIFSAAHWHLMQVLAA